MFNVLIIHMYFHVCVLFVLRIYDKIMYDILQ